MPSKALFGGVAGDADGRIPERRTAGPRGDGQRPDPPGQADAAGREVGQLRRRAVREWPRHRARRVR